MNVPTPSRLARYLTVIIRWLAITFVVFVLTILTGLYITDNLLPKVYTATAEIQIRPLSITDMRSHLPSVTSVTFEKYEQDFLDGQLKIIQSPDILLPIIHDLGLDKAWATRIFKSTQDQLSDQDALAYMNKILKLDFVRGSTTINITVSSDVPEETAAIANAIADRYKTLRDVEENQRNNRGEDALRDQIAQQQKVVDDAKAALEKIRQNLKPGILIHSDDGTTDTLVPFRDAQQNLERQQSLLDALNVRLQQALVDDPLMVSAVRIISRAEVPTIPTQPNRSIAFLVIIVMGCVLPLMVASFVEIILLFSRAGERAGN